MAPKMTDNGGESAKENRYWVGFDLGGTKMMATVFDNDFRPQGRQRKKTKAAEGAEEVMDRVIATMEEALQDAKVGRDKLAGIGVGFPGPLDLDRGVILDAPNLRWKHVALRKMIEKAFACPAVIVNDVDAGVYGEYRLGAAQGARCVVGVFPGTGIGGGCVYEGRLIRGRTQSCFEIGHCQVLPDGPLCGCGQRGCLEAVASRSAIAAAAAAAAARGEAPYLLEHAGTDLANIRSGALAEAVRGGDRAVEQIIRDAGRWLGVGISIAVNLMAPDVVVIGGGLVEAMPKLILESVRESASRRMMPAFRDSVQIVASRLGDDATAAGAAVWARDSLAVGAGPRDAASKG